MKDRSALTIVALTVVAFALALGHFSLDRSGNDARAAETVVGRTYSISTARVVDGGEGIYVFDNDREMVALFIWDAGDKRFTPRDVRSIGDLFAGAR